MKTAARKHTRRLISASLIFAMLTGIVPMPAHAAAGDVAYHRAEPEVGILNRATGESAALYRSIKGPTSGADAAKYAFYNAVPLYGANYDTRATGDTEWTWQGGDFADSTLKKLMQPYDNLQSNVSATFYNRKHKHKQKKNVLYDYVNEVTSYETANFMIGGCYNRSVGGDGNIMATNARVGDDTGNYQKLTYFKDEGGRIKFASPKIGYMTNELKYCTCGGTYAEKVVLTFRDVRAPLLSSVEYSTDGGKTWRNRWKATTYVGKEQTLKIRLTYDEPIRFADDKGTGKGDLYLALMSDGKDVASAPHAMLEELNGNSLTFSCTYDKEEALNITALDVSSLFPSGGTGLVQLKGSKYGGETFEIKEFAGEGFNKASSYITDLAGNALTRQNVTKTNLVLDGAAPYVARVDYTLGLNNADVKEALGKPATDDGSKDWTDASDLYLGAGDTVQMKITMNEELNIKTYNNGITYRDLVATTNLRDKYGDIVTATSSIASTGTGENKYTTFVMDTIVIEDGMVLEGDGLKVTKLEWASGAKQDVADLAGNTFSLGAVDPDVNKNPPVIDTAAPTVGDDGYTYHAEDNSFTYKFAVSDGDGSGATGIFGTFTLNNKGDGKSYRYEWAVTAADGSAVSEWNTGTTGVAQQFKQNDNNFLHIRPIDSESYGDLSGCTITVEPKDFAGNKGQKTLPADGSTLDWYVDNLAPTVRAENASRKLNGSDGELSVYVIMNDTHGVSAWKYAWGDDKTTAPTGEDDWQDGELTATTSGSASATLTEKVASGTNFSKYLWVKATDNSSKKNESEPICLGQYSYNLAKVAYQLDYSTAISSAAHIAVSTLPENDTLVFMVKVPKAYSGDDNHYAVLALTNAHDDKYTGEQDDAWVNGSRNIFDIDKTNQSLALNAWYYMTAERTLDGNNNVKYTFAADSQYEQEGKSGLPLDLGSSELPSGVKDWWSGIRAGTESGTLDVTVLAGTWGAVERWQQTNTGADTSTTTAPSYLLYAPIVAGTDKYPISEEHFRLRIAGDNWAKNYEGISVKCSEAGKTLTSPIGVTYTISIDKDVNGWDYEDIDWEHSYIRLIHLFPGNNTRYLYGSKDETSKLPLVPFKVQSDGSTSQTLTVPALPFEWGQDNNGFSGLYFPEIHLAFHSGMKAYDDNSIHDEMLFYVDNTIPTDKFSLSSIEYDPGLSFKSTTSSDMHNAYKLVDTYGTRTVYEQDGRFTVPVGKLTNISVGEKYTLKVAVEDGEAPDGYGTGKFKVQMWNITNANNKIMLTGNESQTEFTLDKIKLSALNLKENEDNTIAMQKIYANGRESGVQYAVIHPAADSVEGTAKIDNANRQLIFKPNGGVQPASVFAWAFSDEQKYWFGEGERIEMALQSDGTWTCALTDAGANYHIVTESTSGSLVCAAVAHQRAPRFAEDGISITGNADGTYSMEINIRDDYETITEDGMDVDIDVSFADSGDTAESTGSYHFTLNDTAGHHWTADSKQETGFLSVNATGTDYHNGTNTQANYDILKATVNGVYRVGSDTMTVTVTATDAAGYVGSSTVTVNTNPVAPEALTSGEDAPYFTKSGLGVKFNQPVRPMESWAWKDKDGSVYQTAWEGAFPVPGNGTHIIHFTDIFGNEYARDITTSAFTDANGTDRSVEFALSETEPTDKDVTLTTNVQQGVVKVWEINGSNSTTLPDETGVHYAKRRTTTLDHNAELSVRSYPDETGNADPTLSLRVYIDNVAKGAPTAEVYYYVAALGEEFTADGLQKLLNECGGKLSVLGNVNARYETSRHVTPSGGTQSEHLFTPTDSAAYTFKYVDDLGQEGTAEAQLPEGLTLTAPQEPPEDNTPPVVSVDIYAKRGGRYEGAESFLPGDVYTTTADIAAKFTEVGYVQGYNLTVNASDESGFDIDMTSDNGSTLSGNVITVTKGGTVTVTVTDKSKNANQVKFTVTIPENLLDNTPPKATVSSVYTTVYTKNLYIKLEDNTDGRLTLDAPAGLSIVTADEAANKNSPDYDHAGAYRYPALANGTMNFTFHDEAGNRGTAEAKIIGLDVDPPKLSVRWSPPLITKDANGQTTRDETHPTSDTVNTSITASIDSSKPMKTLTMAIGESSETQKATEVSLLANGAAVQPSYSVLGQDNKILAVVTAAPTAITVSYRESGVPKLTFTATAPNNKSATLTLDPLGANAIDRTAPTVDVTQTEVERTGATKPYAVDVTMEPSEDVYFTNYGEQGKLYKKTEPLEAVRFTENGTYTVRCVDMAGNIGSETFTISGIDNTPPKLTLSKTDGGQSSKVTIAVSEPCTVTWGKGEKHEFTAAGSTEVTLTENGTYVFAATDAAGNESVKTVIVGSIDNIPPSISFATNTIYLFEGAGESELDAELAKGCTVWDDNQSSAVPTVSYDKSEVKLNEAGQYTVLYTVTDAAGNVTTANRFVRVIGKDTTGLEVDGTFVLPDSTAVIKPGVHTLTLRGSSEPYSVKARRGILSAGQMKYQNASSLSFTASGSFNVTETGYYTVLVTTQSRETIRLLLCVER